MNKKVIGIVLIIIGTYLLIGNTIMSILFNYAGPIGFDVLINSSDYWSNWWNNYGLITIIIAVIGVMSTIFGIWIFKGRKRNLVQL
ncbi:MAG: hypothetical protein EU533_09420 [Promethearchaeota archaeon]|nr:MAG: hypothetical protein EU533_09420 [Candidatus Lokiarchaeota archaeon]